MYNHYIPQSDGSYRRSTIQDPGKRPPQHRPPAPKPPAPPPPPKPEPEPCQEETRPQSCPTPSPESQPPQGCADGGILSFLKGLLPRQIDSTDLLVILLLLLMNKDEDCDGLSPILTLALYFLL